MPLLPFFTGAFLFISVVSAAQIIPSSKRVDWAQAGLESKMDTPSIILNVMNFNATADGLTDDFAAIDSAIKSLNGSPGIIFFPAGTYMVKSTISLPDSIILTGVSSDSTALIFDLPSSGNCINIHRSQRGSFVSITGGYVRGSSSITLSNVTGLSAGDWVEIRQENGAWDVQPVSGVTYCVGQIVQVAAINGNQIMLQQPLRYTYSTALNPELRKLNPARQIGIENLKVERKTDPGSGAGRNFSFGHAVNCWITGVESHKSIGAHVLINVSSHLAITGSYFHEAFTYNGSGTRGYGICIIQHSGDVLVENNIFRKLRHAMMVKQGANGNVFGYNYSLEPHRSELQSDYGGDISLHGHFPFANLFEGNIVQNIHLDYTWGPSGPLNTFFRNRAELFGIWMTPGTYPSDSQNFVGNEVTHTLQNLYFGLLKKGNYSLSGSHHFEYANLIKMNTSQGTIIPANTATLTDKSYYLNATPAFWDISDSFPSIGPGNALDAQSNPASERYSLSSSKTISNTPLPVELISFCVAAIENEIEIKWSTASEHQSDYFEIERSPDLYTIKTIAIEPGAGYSTTLLMYDVKDKKPLKGFSYYRLKQVDFDGAVNYYDWVPVGMDEKAHEEMKIYPQPMAGRQLWLEIPKRLQLPVIIYITDSLGRQVMRQQKEGYRISLTLPGNLKSGTYHLVVIDTQQQTKHGNIIVL